MDLHLDDGTLLPLNRYKHGLTINRWPNPLTMDYTRISKLSNPQARSCIDMCNEMVINSVYFSCDGSHWAEWVVKLTDELNSRPAIERSPEVRHERVCICGKTFKYSESFYRKGIRSACSSKCQAEINKINR